MNRRRDALPPELSDTADLLRDERATLDPLADERLRARLDRAASRRAAGPRRSSIAITLCLALGALFSVGGTSLAVSGLSSSDVTAKSAQYPTATTPSSTSTTQSGDSEVLGEQGSTEATGDGVSADGPGSDDGDGGVAGEADSSSDPDQAARQVAASDAEGLPFTGYAAVPLLLLGVALLASGVVLRRRTTDR